MMKPASSFINLLFFQGLPGIDGKDGTPGIPGLKVKPCHEKVGKEIQTQPGFYLCFICPAGCSWPSWDAWSSWLSRSGGE